MSSDRFSLREVAVPVAVAAIMVTITVPLALGSVASGTSVETAPGTVFRLSGCTGFAISESVLLTAKHCGITQDHPLISMTGERPRVVKVIDVLSQADTVCEGDSGAPALQGDRVTGIVTGGDGPPCGTAVASAVAVQPAVDWLRSHGVV